jgi:hypothetical protein
MPSHYAFCAPGQEDPLSRLNSPYPIVSLTVGLGSEAELNTCDLFEAREINAEPGGFFMFLA